MSISTDVKMALKVREIANEILKSLYETGEFPKLSHSSRSVKKAYQLLIFERLLSNTGSLKLSERGKAHLEQHGPEIYPSN